MTKMFQMFHPITHHLWPMILPTSSKALLEVWWVTCQTLGRQVAKALWFHSPRFAQPKVWSKKIPSSFKQSYLRMFSKNRRGSTPSPTWNNMSCLKTYFLEILRRYCTKWISKLNGIQNLHEFTTYFHSLWFYFLTKMRPLQAEGKLHLVEIGGKGLPADMFKHAHGINAVIKALGIPVVGITELDVGMAVMLLSPFLRLVCKWLQYMCNPIPIRPIHANTMNQPQTPPWKNTPPLPFSAVHLSKLSKSTTLSWDPGYHLCFGQCHCRDLDIVLGGQKMGQAAKTKTDLQKLHTLENKPSQDM